MECPKIKQFKDKYLNHKIDYYCYMSWKNVISGLIIIIIGIIMFEIKYLNSWNSIFIVGGLLVMFFPKELF